MRPLHLPLYVILMPDAAHARLAWEVAQLMSQVDQTVFIDDFNAPIREAHLAMWDKDYRKDYGDPRVSEALMLEALKPDTTEADCIASLREWFDNQYGPDRLGIMGHKRAVDQQTITEYIYVFRDATPYDLGAFISSQHINTKRDLLIASLADKAPLTANQNVPMLSWLDVPADPAQIISDLEEKYRSG